MSKNALFIVLRVLIIFGVCFAHATTSLAYVEGNKPGIEGKKGSKYYEPEDAPEKIYDDTMRIYLDSAKTFYKAGETPEILIYLKNEGKETRYFKRVWSPSGAEGSRFKIFMDNKESWGSGVFKREPVTPESADPEDALRLDPGEKAPIQKLVFLRLAEGAHTINAEYEAKYSVTEKKSRNWWQGAASSNILTLKVARALPQKEVDKALESVIKAIHSDTLAAAGRHTELSGYGDGSISRPKTAFHKLPVIDFHKPRPSRIRFNVYFNKTGFEPSTLATLEDGFPFLGVSLFAHIDTEKNAALRATLIDIARGRGRALNDVMRKLEKYYTVAVQPFEPPVAAQFERAQIILLGTVLDANVESDRQFEYQLKKWVLTIKVDEVYKGKVEGKKISGKCGALNVTFGSGKVVGGKYIIMLLDKQGWQQEYPIVGGQRPRENLIDWLRKLTKGGK